MIIMIAIITMIMMLITFKNFINKFSNNLKFTMYDLLER